MEQSVFSKILAGAIPGEIIYRDDTVAVICTIQPFNPGHVLVIPVTQVDHLWDLDSETYSHLMHVAQEMALTIRSAYPEYCRIGMAVEGFEVPHAHVHVFGMHAGFSKTLPPQGESVPIATSEDLHIAAEKLRAYLTL